MPLPLDARRRAQLAEIERIEASHDVLSPTLFRRLRDLAMGEGAASPGMAADALAIEIDRLAAISRDQWAKLKRCVFALRQARAAHAIDASPATRRRVMALRQDAGWQLNAFAATRRRLADLAARHSVASPADDARARSDSVGRIRAR